MFINQLLHLQLQFVLFLLIKILWVSAFNSYSSDGHHYFLQLVPNQPFIQDHVETSPPAWDCFHVSAVLNVLCSRIAGWWRFYGGLATTVMPNTFRPSRCWGCAMRARSPETWKISGLYPLDQPAHGVTGGTSTLNANRKEKERTIEKQRKRKELNN